MGLIHLLPMTADLLDAEDAGRPAFPMPPPLDWPPEFHGPETRAWMRRMLTVTPGTPFAGYYVLADGLPVGTSGFKGPPDASGRVDIGYSIVPSEQRKGHAAAAVRALLAIAAADPRVARVVAETIPDRVASQRTVLSCGFVLTDRRPDKDFGEILTFTWETRA
jgi:ribosomal-protein-alanine N-acetyltransferase